MCETAEPQGSHFGRQTRQNVLYMGVQIGPLREGHGSAAFCRIILDTCWNLKFCAAQKLSVSAFRHFHWLLHIFQSAVLSPVDNQNTLLPSYVITRSASSAKLQASVLHPSIRPSVYSIGHILKMTRQGAASTRPAYFSSLLCECRCTYLFFL